MVERCRETKRAVIGTTLIERSETLLERPQRVDNDTYSQDTDTVLTKDVSTPAGEEVILHTCTLCASHDVEEANTIVGTRCDKRPLLRDFISNLLRCLETLIGIPH